MAKKRKTEKPPPVDRLLIPAVGVVVAFLGYYFMKGINTEVSHFEIIHTMENRHVLPDS